jgi:4-hydroxy-tetrahydrodipicolinate synthase
MHEMALAALSGDAARARALDAALRPLHDALFVETSPGPVKFAAALLGKTSEHCRLPLARVMESTRAKVRAAMTEVGLLN